METNMKRNSGLNRRALLSTLAALPLLPGLPLTMAARAQAPVTSLASWNDGLAKQAIVDFVARVTRQGGPDFVPPAERIAAFDNDGTLWVEQPMYVQLAFVLDRVKAIAPQHPDWEDKQPFKAVLERDMRTLGESGEHGLMELMAATHAGITTDDFVNIVSGWLATDRDQR